MIKAIYEFLEFEQMCNSFFLPILADKKDNNTDLNLDKEIEGYIKQKERIKKAYLTGIVELKDFEEDLKKTNEKLEILNNKKQELNELDVHTFTIEKVIVNDLYNDKVKKDFYVYTVINGDGYISDGYENIKLNKEDTVYIEHNTRYKIFGKLELIKSYV